MSHLRATALEISAYRLIGSFAASAARAEKNVSTSASPNWKGHYHGRAGAFDEAAGDLATVFNEWWAELSDAEKYAIDPARFDAEQEPPMPEPPTDEEMIGEAEAVAADERAHYARLERQGYH